MRSGSGVRVVGGWLGWLGEVRAEGVEEPWHGVWAVDVGLYAAEGDQIDQPYGVVSGCKAPMEESQKASREVEVGS